MNIQILEKENQELKKHLEQLIKVSEEVLNENARESEEIRRLLLHQTGINNKIKEIYLLLVSEIRGNGGFLWTDSKDITDIFDNLRILVKAALHDRESFERENEVLQKIIRRGN